MTALARREDAALTANGNGALPDLAETARSIEQLVAEGDETMLRDFGNQAEAHRLYREAAGRRGEANHFGRLGLLAESGLGALSIAETPKLPVGAPGALVDWRALAMGHERGALMPACDRLDAAGHTITSSKVARLMIREGWTRADTTLLFREAKRRADAEGISRQALAAQIGVPRHTFYHAPVTQWPWARAIAEKLDIDPLTLPPMPSTRKPRRKRSPLWLTRERKRTGGKWDRAYGYFRQCLDEFKDLAPNVNPKWDEAYAHLYAIEQIIAKQMYKERER